MRELTQEENGMLCNELHGLKSVLNIGAGAYFSTEERTDFWKILGCYERKVAVEALPNKAATYVNTDWIPLQMQLVQTLPFPSGCFDVVIGTDFIEHLHKPQATNILVEAERVARRYIIWFTPIGFLDTQKYQNESVYSDLDIHNSQWQPEEFRQRGYQVDVIKNMHNFGKTHFDAMWAYKEK